MENLMNLYKGERTNDYFKNYAIAQIMIAHRIKEYLDPDEYFPAKDLVPQTKEMLLGGDPAGAPRIIDEVPFVNDHIDSSSGYDTLVKEADAFIGELRADYFKRQDKEKVAERERLLKRLATLDAELGIKEA